MASSAVQALRAQLVGVVDLQNRGLLDHAEQHQNAQRRVEIQRLAAEPQAEQPEGHGQRQREQNRQRMDEVLELGGQHDVHEDERQHERPAEIAQRPLEFAAAAHDARAVAGRHAQFLGRLPHGLDAVAQGVARGDIRAKRGHPLPIESVDPGGVLAESKVDHVVQPGQSGGVDACSRRHRPSPLACGDSGGARVRT